MIDDIIAYAFDDDGNRSELSLRDVYLQCGEMLKILYFDAMIRGNGEDETMCFSHSKKLILECCGQILDNIHNKYEDHIEDARNQVFGTKDKKTDEG
jgi:hypothetical protein